MIEIGSKRTSGLHPGTEHHVGPGICHYLIHHQNCDIKFLRKTMVINLSITPKFQQAFPAYLSVFYKSNEMLVESLLPLAKLSSIVMHVRERCL